jgi:hypothetical protein
MLAGILQTRHRSSNLDPVLVPSVQNILSVGMLQDQTFSSGLHDGLHTFSDVLSGLSLKLGYKLNAALSFGETGMEVPLAKLARLMEERLAIEVQQIENLD